MTEISKIDTIIFASGLGLIVGSTLFVAKTQYVLDNIEWIVLICGCVLSIVFSILFYRWKLKEVK